MPPLLAVLHDDQRAAIAKQVHDLQPVLEVGVLLAFVGHQDVHGPLGQEELMGRVVYLLAAEIPDVHPEVTLEEMLAGLVTHPDARRELPGHHVDSLGGILGGVQLVVWVKDLFRQRCLARAGFPNDQQLRLGEVIDTRIAFLRPVAPDRIKALRRDLGRRYHEFLRHV